MHKKVIPLTPQLKNLFMQQSPVGLFYGTYGYDTESFLLFPLVIVSVSNFQFLLWPFLFSLI